MKTPMQILLMGILFTIMPLSCFAEDIYISQSSQGADTGTDCLNAHSVSWFNTSGNWGTGAGKINAGDTAHLCGTINTSLTVQGSGSAGSPITIVFENGAKISEASCGNGCLKTNNNVYLIIDGGTNGIVEATNMGTGKAQTQSTAIDAMQCGNCEIKNLHIHDMYVRTSSTDLLGGGDASSYDAIRFSGSNFLFHNNTIHDVGWAIRNMYAVNDTNVRVYNNDISNCAHTYALAATGGVVTSGSFYYYGNYVHDFANWDATGCTVAHTSAIHAYGIGGSKITGTLWIYDNRFVGTGSCMTANIFLEGGTDAWTDSTGSAKIFNNYITATGYVTGLVQPSNGNNHEIYNNTIIGNGDSNTMCLNIRAPSTNVTIKNNAIGNCGFLMNAYANQAIDPGLTIDYNQYFNCSSYNCFWVGTTSTGSFSSYRSAKPSYDPHSLNNTASATGGLSNGIPQAGAPVINAGVNLTSIGISALNSDINGQPRPITGSWSIGAYHPVFKLPLPPEKVGVN